MSTTDNRAASGRGGASIGAALPSPMVADAQTIPIRGIWPPVHVRSAPSRRKQRVRATSGQRSVSPGDSGPEARRAVITCPERHRGPPLERRPWDRTKVSRRLGASVNESPQASPAEPAAANLFTQLWGWQRFSLCVVSGWVSGPLRWCLGTLGGFSMPHNRLASLHPPPEVCFFSFSFFCFFLSFFPFPPESLLPVRERGSPNTGRKGPETGPPFSTSPRPHLRGVHFPRPVLAS